MGAQIRNCVILTEQETARVNRFIEHVGKVGVAMRRLGLSDSTFNAARGYGRMMGVTREKVLAALTREEAAA